MLLNWILFCKSNLDPFLVIGVELIVNQDFFRKSMIRVLDKPPLVKVGEASLKS